MSNPRIGRAAEEVASKKSLEVLDDNPVRGSVELTEAERADREQEKTDLLQRLGVRSSAPAVETSIETGGEVEPEHETAVEGPASAEINALLGRLDAEHEVETRTA